MIGVTPEERILPPWGGEWLASGDTALMTVRIAGS